MGAGSNVIALKGVQAFATNRRSPVHPRMPPPDTIAAVKGFRDVLPDETGRTLRPEATAGVVRAYLESGLAQSDPSARLYYRGPMFRRERPQRGRYRQFYQIGAEVLGREDPLADAELLVMLDRYLAGVGARAT